MPRKKPPDDPNAPIPPKPPRQRKKKEPAGKANDAIKLEAGAGLGGYDPATGGPPPGMGMPHMQNGIPGHHMMMAGPEGIPTGPDGMPLPYGHPPHPEYFYQGPPPPSVSNPHGYAPSPHQPLPPQHQFVEPDMPSTQNPYLPPHQGAMPPGTPQSGQPMLIRFRQMPMMAPWPYPYPPFLEYRLNEMNRRLYQWYITNLNPDDHQQWWQAFSHEFFDDDAKLTIIPLTNDYDEKKQYILPRLLIPRYFRTLYDGGVKEMSYVLRSEGVECMSRTQPGACALECESVLIVTRHEKPVPAQVQTECRMLIEFVPYQTTPQDCGYRIKNWRIELKGCQEFISKDINDNDTQERIRHGITKSGLPHGALEYLKLCMILEPMQILMRETQNDNLTPNDAMKTILFNAHMKRQALQQQQQLDTPQSHMNPMGPMGPLNPPHMLPQPPIEEPTTKKPTRKRVRNNTKAAAGGAGGGGGGNSKKKNNNNSNNTASPAPNGPNFPVNPGAGMFPMHYGQNPAEVLIVGEPSMMGSEYGEEDERTISRIENTQYDPNLMQHNHPGGPPVQLQHNGPGIPGMPVHSMPAPMPHRQQCPPGLLGDFDFSQSGGMPPAGLWPNPMPIGASPSSCHGAPIIGASGDM